MSNSKDTIAKSYAHFVRSFGASELVVAKDLFDSQANINKARKVLGKAGLKSAPGAYFNQFLTPKGLDHKALGLAIQKNRKVMARHLGPEAMLYLDLVTQLIKDMEQPKLGLLEVA